MPAENGYVPTPETVADYAASTAFGAIRPDDVDGGRILFPGLGTGRLYDAVRRYCTQGEGRHAVRSWEFDLPECVGVENNPARIAEFREHHPDSQLHLHEANFLLDPPEGEFDWVLMNPPFMRYSRLDADVRDQYRERYWTAGGSFGLHVPFVEAALKCLRPGGELTTFLPIGTLFQDDCQRLRTEIRSNFSDPIMFLPDAAFDAQVLTVLITLKRRPGGAPDGSIYLGDLYEHELREMLAGLPVEDVDAAVDEYYDMHRHFEYHVRKADLDDRGITITHANGAPQFVKEGPADARQGSLGEWT